MSVFLIIGLVFVGIAAIIHKYIFYMESITWAKPATWKRFGLRSQEDADTVKPMAYNQGFYNLFLALGIVVGIILTLVGLVDVGRAVALFGALSMVAAATVLVTSNPKLARAAALQGTAPLLGVIFIGLSYL
jgi:putative membrane protein